MNESTLNRMIREHKARIIWALVFLILAVFVTALVFGTLKRSVQAQTYTKRVFACSYAQEGAEPVAHQHNDDCYENGELICTLPERELHIHGDECYTEEKVLVCTLEESEGHVHTDACYTEEPVLVCGLEENNGHVHSVENGCYTRVQGDLICTDEDPEHVHTDECYAWEEVLTCEIPEGEGAHHHSEECYETQRVLSCGKEEGEGAHTHDDTCYEIQKVLICDKEEVKTEHVHTVDCFQVVDMSPEEIHALHMSELPESDPDADVETPDVWESRFASVPLSGEWDRDLLKIAETQLGYTESQRNFDAVLNEDGEGYTLKGWTRYGAWYGIPYGDWCAMFISFCLNYADIPESAVPYDCATTTWIDSLSARGMYAPAGSYDPKPGDLIFFDWEGDGLSDHVGIVWAVNSGSITTIEGNHTISVELFDYDLSDGHIQGYGILPENPALAVADSEENSEGNEPGENENQDVAEGEAASAAGISDSADTSGTNNNSVDGEDTDKTELDAETLAKMPPFSYSERVAGMRVSIEADEGAFPEGTTVEIKAIKDDGLAEQVAPVVNGKVVQVQAVDITFYDAEGNEIEPRIPIRVTMRPNTETDEANGVEVVHVDNEGNVNAVTPDEGITQPDKGAAFDADSFSPYVLVYVLKFDYPVNGKTYESELAGGEDLSLSNLLVQLGVCGEEEVSEFVSKIDSVTASDPEALSVSEKEGVWTVRPMKDSEGELSLAIEMQDGAKFSVQVQANGKTEVSSEDNNTVITAVNDLYLPENAVAETAVLTEEESTDAIAAVEKAVEQEAPEAAAAPAAEAEGETPTVSQVAYQVFSISLDGVEYSKYEDGFQVSLTLPENVAGKDFEVYHVDEEGNATKLETVDTDAKSLTDETDLVSTVSFVTPSFDQFVVRYTVDFHYKVNGQNYEFSFAGGSFVSLEKLVELLKIAYEPEEPVQQTAEPVTNEYAGEGSKDEYGEDGLTENYGTDESADTAENETHIVFSDILDIEVSERTKNFVANIENVTFTRPEYIWVGKIEEEITVGDLKEEKDLECQYSAELTEEQIAAINAQTITAGDWALISLLPFSSEESLTIIMKDGKVFTIRVTDEQQDGQVELEKNYTYNAFVTDPNYAQYYNSNSPLGIAGSFHIVAFDTATLGAHTNGNILAHNLDATGNGFGTKNIQSELSYIQNYIKVNGNSGSDSTPDGLLVLGDDVRDPKYNKVDYVDNHRYFSVNGEKLNYPRRVVQDEDTTNNPFIDLTAVKTFITGLSSSLKSNGDFAGIGPRGSNENIEAHITDTDQNFKNFYITLKGADLAGYVNVSAHDINKLGIAEQTIKIYGFLRGHTGSVIINVDCSGFKEITLPHAYVFLNNTEVPRDETVDFDGGKVIWNFINADGVKINTSRMTGIIIAPNSDVNLRYSFNGTVVANNVENHTETHRTDFTGTTNPTNKYLTAEKTVNGSTPSDGQIFNFTLDALKDGNWVSVKNDVINSGGSVAFPNQTYTNEGSFWYCIYESVTGRSSDYVYDDSRYLVNVIIENDGGNMTVAGTHKYKLSPDTDMTSFLNDYLRPIIAGNKTIQDAKNDGIITDASKVSFANYSNTTTSLTVNKEWIGQPTESITIRLYRHPADADDENDLEPFGEPETLSSANSWQHTFINLPKYKIVDGNRTEFIYTVEEEVPNGYISTIDYSPDRASATITNTEVINITLEKLWKNGNNNDPDPTIGTSATFTLHRQKSVKNGSSYSEYDTDPNWEVVTINLPTEGGGWSTTFTDLIKEDGDGNRYQYYITEDDCTPSATSVTFKNSLNQVITGTQSNSISSNENITVINEINHYSFAFTKKWIDFTTEIPWDNDIEVTVYRKQGDTEDDFSLVYPIRAKQVENGNEISPEGGTKPKLKVFVSPGVNGTNTYVFTLDDLENKYDDSTSSWKYTYYAIETNDLIEGYKAPTYLNNSSHSDVAFNDGEIINTKDNGYELPKTGGPGTALYGLLGGLMVVTAGAVLTLRRKKNKA